MDKKEIEGAKQLIEIPDVKKGSYSFIGDSTITYADIRNLLDYIKDLEQENMRLQKKIDKVIENLDELLVYNSFNDTTSGFGNVKETLKFYLSDYETLEEFRRGDKHE